MSQVERYWTMNIKKSSSLTQSHPSNVFCPVSADALKTLRWWRSLGISSWSPVANGHSLLDLGRAWKRINNTEITVFIIGGVLIKKSFFFEERRETFLAGLSLSPSFSCEFEVYNDHESSSSVVVVIDLCVLWRSVICSWVRIIEEHNESW